jgi:hypothetical protein
VNRRQGLSIRGIQAQLKCRQGLIEFFDPMKQLLVHRFDELAEERLDGREVGLRHELPGDLVAVPWTDGDPAQASAITIEQLKSLTGLQKHD